MTRDELIDRTKRLIAEGERLLAAPSLEALRTWLQLSDEMLAAAWGSMDRYHLAWLSVGKPKEIVRGRPMTADEEAAYVREVAAPEDGALRMSLDAVERQGMPFRGETAGSGSAARPRRGRRSARARRAARFDVPSEADELAARVRQAREEAARPRRGTSTAAGAPAGEDAAMSAAGPRPSVARATFAPDPVARDYLLLALRLDRHIPGLVDGYFGPADLRAQVDAEQPRSPARLVDDAADAARASRRPRSTSPTGAAGSTPSSSPSRRRRARWPAIGLPYLEHVTACFDYRPTRTPEAVFDAAAAELDALLPGAGPLAEPDRRLG